MDQYLLPAPIQHALSFCIEQMILRGATSEQLLRGSGIGREGCGSLKTLITQRQALAIYHNILRLGGDAIGLELGRAVKLRVLGSLGVLIGNAPDLEHAAYLLRRFQRLGSLAFESYLIGEVAPNQLLVRYQTTHDTGEAYRLLIDLELRAVQQMMTEVFGGTGRQFIHSITLAYPEPRNAADYVDEFGCRVRFGYEHTYVTFDKRYASAVNPQRSEIAYNNAVRQCNEAISAYTPRGWHQRVLNILASSDDYPRTDVMAATLSCSERSLRRHLKHEGYRYSELLDRIRFERARYLLTYSHDSIKKISLKLRYSEPANFVHAFTRWSGIAPGQFRQRVNAKENNR